MVSLRALASTALLSSVSLGANAAPMLSGTPATTVVAAHYYAFQPGSGSTGGKPLSFTITNKPAWATFDTGSGRLYGTPLPQAHVGIFSNISISASDGVSRAYLAPFSIKVAPLPTASPVLGGKPAATATAGRSYNFQPTANDPNGLRLTFAVSNKPAWASFNANTGALSGTPVAANAGTYPNIVITAYDGYAKATLPAFAIAVQSSSGAGTPPPPVVSTPPATITSAATLNWVPPTQTNAGGVLTNLAGYHIYYGTTPSNLAKKVVVANPGVTRYVIGGLTSTSTWYFQLTAYDSKGLESLPTAVEQFIVR